MRALASDDPGQLLRWLVPAFPILQEAAAHELWDEDLVDALSAAVAGQAREVGALAGLPQALVYRAGVHVLFGEFNTAATLIAEANSITAATTHNGPVRYHSLLVAAWRASRRRPCGRSMRPPLTAQRAVRAVRSG